MRKMLPLYCLMLVSLCGWSAGAARAESPRDDLASVIRLLGYGGGIHHFKNYVLRGQPRYREQAAEAFAQVHDLLARLAGGTQFNTVERSALGKLQAAVDAYADVLQQVTTLHAEGLDVGQIDRLVPIDDRDAKDALQVLRARWEWNDLEQMEYLLGYGHAIHDFKNYVLRGRPRYQADALEHLLAVDALIATQLAAPGIDDASRGALEQVERVVHGYRDYLPLVEKLQAMQRPTHQVDLAVKVNDGPAVAGLAVLRTRGDVQLLRR